MASQQKERSMDLGAVKDSVQWWIMDRLDIADFGMFSIRGNRKVAAMIEQAIRLPEEQQQEFVDAEMDRIGKRHPEVGDTDVREDIAASVPGYDAYA